MTTRDSHAWYVVVGVAWLGSLWAHPDLVEKMMEMDRQSWIAALGQLVAIIGAYLKASPLPISDEGRAKYQTDVVKVPQ